MADPVIPALRDRPPLQISEKMPGLTSTEQCREAMKAAFVGQAEKQTDRQMGRQTDI